MCATHGQGVAMGAVEVCLKQGLSKGAVRGTPANFEKGRQSLRNINNQINGRNYSLIAFNLGTSLISIDLGHGMNSFMLEKEHSGMQKHKLCE